MILKLKYKLTSACNRGHSAASTDNAFTLLEVMVALAIAGILFIAIGSIYSQQMRTQNRLIKKSAADQLAWNLMEDYRLHGKPVEPTLLDGKGVLGGYSFTWQRQIKRHDDSGEWQVTLRVKDGADTLIRQDLLWPLNKQ